MKRTPTLLVLFACLLGAVIAHFTRSEATPGTAGDTDPIFAEIRAVAEAGGDVYPILRRHLKGNGAADLYARARLLPLLADENLARAIGIARTVPELVEPLLAALTFPDSIPEARETARMVIEKRECSDLKAAEIIHHLGAGNLAAADLLLGEFTPKLAAENLRTEIYQLSKSEPERAIDQVLENLSTSGFRGMLANIFNNWSKEDPEAAWNRLATLPKTVDMDTLQVRVLQQYFENDPAGAVDFFTRPGLVLERTAVSNIANRLAKSDLERALEFAQTHFDSPHAQQIFEALAGQFGRLPPAQAFELFETGFYREAPDPHGSRRQFISSVAREHPEETFRWARSYRGEDRIGVLVQVAEAASKTHPDEVFQLLETAALSTSELGKIALAISPLAVQDLDRYYRLLSAVGEEQAVYALVYVADQLVHSGRRAEADTIFNAIGINDDAVASRYQPSVTEHAQWDPAEAARRVSALAPGITREFATQNLIDQWARHDPAAATAYTEALPENSPERQRAAFSLVNRLAVTEPEKSLQWLSEIRGHEELVSAVLSSESLTPLIYHAPDQLVQLFPENETIHRRIAEDQKWREYLRNYNPPSEN